MAKHMAGRHMAPSSKQAQEGYREPEEARGLDEPTEIDWMWDEAKSEAAQDQAQSQGPSHFAGFEEADDSHRHRGNIISNVLIVVGVVLLIVAGVIFFNNQRNYEKIDEENELVAEYAKLSDDGQEPPAVDWESLKAINPDIVGWLQVPGTIINYPVYQAADNSYYLEHAPDRSESIGGSVFLDFESIAPGMVDEQTIIYGHHMRNGSQFKPIADMDNQELFDGVNRIWYVTEQGVWDLAPLFLFYTTETDTNVRQFSFESPEAFHNYLNTYFTGAATKRADAEQIINQCSHVVTLSTCNYYDGLGRSLLVCVLRYEIPGTPEYEQFHAPSAPDPAAEEAAAAEAAAAEAAAAAAAQ